MRTCRTESPRNAGGTRPDPVRLAVIAVATLFALSACAAPDRPAAAPAPATAHAPADHPDVLLCQGNEVPIEALENPRPASELAPAVAPALDGRDVSDFQPLGPLEWLIAQESDDRVMLMHKLAVPDDNGGGDIREYRYFVISTDSMPAQPGESAWAVVESSSCSTTLDLGELGDAGITLDPASPPAPESERLALLVTERECNSGLDASGRVELVELRETETTVELVIGVRPSDAQQATCQSNPATPFTVELERPLGDRVVLNAAVVPARPVT
ncbi:hypothetical protein [Agromyces albus]|uniref:hypothetical protein n=1 Tax=Agromyces albus TaxID=205332 RepID=UPI00277E2C97|nr:hypothetical protein [Agromyces albus]MDQ0576535.1 hypothetical protein [Agromyces albus]